MNELIRIENGEVKLDSRMIAEHFGKEHKNVLRDIQDEVEKLDTAGLGGELIFEPSTYLSQQNKGMPCYEMTEEGAMQLAARYDAVARRKLIIKIKELKEQINTGMDNLSPQLQLLINIELKQKQHDKALADTNARIDGIKEIVSLDSTSWRTDAKSLIVKIAGQMGGMEYIREVQREVYKALDARFGVSLKTRVTNKQRRMAAEGVAKSKWGNVSRLDIIAEDKKLIEGYIAIVKEFAVKYGVADQAS